MQALKPSYRAAIPPPLKAMARKKISAESRKYGILREKYALAKYAFGERIPQNVIESPHSIYSPRPSIPVIKRGSNSKVRASLYFCLIDIFIINVLFRFKSAAE